MFTRKCKPGNLLTDLKGPEAFGYEVTRPSDVTKTGNGEWGMGNGKWEMGNGKWEMGNGKWEIENGK